MSINSSFEALTRQILVLGRYAIWDPFRETRTARALECHAAQALMAGVASLTNSTRHEAPRWTKLVLRKGQAGGLGERRHACATAVFSPPESGRRQANEDSSTRNCTSNYEYIQFQF